MRDTCRWHMTSAHCIPDWLLGGPRSEAFYSQDYSPSPTLVARRPRILFPRLQPKFNFQTVLVLCALLVARAQCHNHLKQKNLLRNFVLVSGIVAAVGSRKLVCKPWWEFFCRRNYVGFEYTATKAWRFVCDFVNKSFQPCNHDASQNALKSPSAH